MYALQPVVSNDKASMAIGGTVTIIQTASASTATHDARQLADPILLASRWHHFPLSCLFFVKSSSVETMLMLLVLVGLSSRMGI